MKRQIFALLLLPSFLFCGYDDKYRTLFLDMKLRVNRSSHKIDDLKTVTYDDYKSGRVDRELLIKIYYQKFVEDVDIKTYGLVLTEVNKEFLSKKESDLCKPAELFPDHYWEDLTKRLVESYAQTDVERESDLDFFKN